MEKRQKARARSKIVWRVRRVCVNPKAEKRTVQRLLQQELQKQTSIRRKGGEQKKINESAAGPKRGKRNAREDTIGKKGTEIVGCTSNLN